ncbi:HD-GYP domain-containing protein [Selenomonas sp. TAMA-11512]|uniref:HD-GYP domain-containing protein n=1 Tax=Selenomonas sp. TAMA-11512 TaxID=3095337 RepID=UPI0030868E32|nr:HD-GYP domain-containing protein [Selenomonas sp. TAMA-11512]
MIRLNLKQLKPGMIPAQSIFNAKGGAFLTRGTQLTDSYIDKLEKIGIDSMNVTSLSTTSKLPPPPDIVDEQVRIRAVKTISSAFAALERNEQFDVNTLMNSAESLVKSVHEMRENLVQLTDIRAHDAYTYAHSVNVAILCSMLGSLLEYDEEQIRILTLGGLLHDIGKVDIPLEILNKKGSLTDDEFKIIRTHSAKGRERLKKLAIPMAEQLAMIAGQHHEHMDGRGYPDRVTEEKLPPMSRICAIADVFDALSASRAYKKSYKPNVVHQIMTKNSPGHFDTELLKLFFDNVAIYPIGTVMRTALGYAIVRRVSFGKTQTPVVTVFASLNARVHEKPFHVDLSQCPPDTIQHVIDGNDLVNFTHQIGVDPTNFIANDILEERARQQSRGNVKAQFLSRNTVKDALKKNPAVS